MVLITVEKYPRFKCLMIKDEDPLLPAQCQKNIVLKMFAGFMGMLIIKGVWFCGVCGSVVCFF